MGTHRSHKEVNRPFPRRLIHSDTELFDESFELNLEERTQAKYKRAFDLSLLILSHLVLLPFFLFLWLLIPLAIWLEDRGPVFFIQKRMGREGKTFRMFKFRTMSDPRHHEMAGEGKQVMRVGRILRATALDEFPQLINIWRGEMSFVGPRPLVPEEARIKLDQNHQEWKLIAYLQPGLTGLAQIFGNREDHVAKGRWDLYYALYMSPWLDLKLLFLSIWVTFRGRWERGGSKA